jgi:uncharacterized membrane protein YfcA
MIIAIKIILGLLTFTFTGFFFVDFFKNKKNLSKTGWLGLIGIGFITNLLDTLGIGSFATQTSLFKLFRLVEDRLIPGTLNVGNTIPVVIQAFIFMTIIKVEPITLISMLAAAPIGAVLGASIVAKLPVRKIQFCLGIALLAVASTMFLGLVKLFPSGGNATGLTAGRLVLATVVSFILGSLHTIGIGFYAPCMALVYALGMSPKVAFPIMMGSAAVLMPAASIKFIKEKAQDRKASMALALFGILGVLLAAYIIISLPLTALKWVVIVVMLYTSFTLLKSANQI